MGRTERFWPRRLRWRLRGAWQWPAFVLLTFADGLVLHLLPPARTGVSLAFGLVAASFGNLFLLGAVAPWLARRLATRSGGPEAPSSTAESAEPLAGARSRTPGRAAAPATYVPSPPSAPPEVLLDRTATALLAAGLLGVLAAGLASRPLVVSETEATEENARVVRDYLLSAGSEEAKRNIDTANTIRLEEGYFRTCIAADDRRLATCLFVDTKPEPPTVKPDPSRVPNALFLRGG